MTVMHLAVAGALATALLANPARAASYLPCPDSALPGLAGTVCTNETVPAIHGQARAQPDSDLQLFVRKFPAAGVARGAVWLVAGGPGESGASLYGMVDTLRSAFPGLDLLVPDHRGTGYSSRLCPKEEAVGSPGGLALAGAEWGSCFQRLNAAPALAATFSLTQAAHDLRWLIANTPTKGPVYVYGVSYGTQLVLRALQVGQLPVAGVVLDSLVPLQTAAAWDLSRRSQVVDMVGRNILSDCDRDPGCQASMGGGAENAYRRLLALIDQQPTIAAAIPGKNIKRFLGGMLDVPTARARIPYLIRDLEQGRREELDKVLAALTAAGASLGAYPQSPPSVPLVSIISGSENNLRPELSLEELQREEQSLLFSSRLPELLVKPGLPLYPRDRYFGKVPDTLPPLLVLNGTRDPKTPFEGAVEHVAALRKAGAVSFVTVDNAPHFILWTAPQCFVAATRRFVEGGAVVDQHCAM